MKITIKFDLDQNVHSTNELTEASKYLKLLSQHIEQNIDKKKLDRIIGTNQPIHRNRNFKKYGRMEQKTFWIYKRWIFTFQWKQNKNK